MSSAATISGLKIAATAAYLLAWPSLLLWLSGDAKWLEGWAFSLWFVTLCATSVGWLYRRDPELLSERFRKPGTGGQSRDDALLVYGLLFGFIAWIVVAPLDARRFGWTPRLPPWLETSGGLLLLAAAFFFFRSFTDNTFLSPLVRIQRDRHHRVVSTGVYGLVRHPMYLGATLMFLGGPLLLGSAWDLGVGAALVLLLARRILGEEALLARDLEGYDSYRKRVRYRLLPGIW
jgi:protein-S-isoprenylcysteine O-methyltransferase Ste14